MDKLKGKKIIVYEYPGNEYRGTILRAGKKHVTVKWAKKHPDYKGRTTKFTRKEFAELDKG